MCLGASSASTLSLVELTQRGPSGIAVRLHTSLCCQSDNADAKMQHNETKIIYSYKSVRTPVLFGI